MQDAPPLLSGSGIFSKRRPWRVAFRLLLLAAVLSRMGISGARADDLLPGAPPLCQATFGNAGGQDASFDLATGSALSNADGSAAIENSSHAEIGLGFTPAVSFPATLSVGVSFSGLLVGSLDVNTIYGEVEITATLRDLDEGLDLATEVVLDQKEDGEPFQTIFNVVASNPFDPAAAVFENVDLIGGHDYEVVVRIVTRAKGLAGRSDFKGGGRFVRLGCVEITPELVDSDGDGLYDDWEVSGIHVDDDGVVDVDLPAFGARPDHKDLFVEMDWRPSRQPKRAEIQAMKEAFALAPVDAGGTPNPDGQPGINLWVDTGGLLEDGQLVGDDLGGGGDVLPDPVICLDDSFYEAKAQFFDPARLVAFRYAISGTPGENECENGQVPGGQGEIGGNDFVVYSTIPGIVFHELGHTLSLEHGGFEGLNNKPNYISMMNYNYGFNIAQNSGGGILDFSPPRCASCPGGRGAIPAPLDERALSEATVLDPNDNENMFQFRDALAITTNAPTSGQDTDSDGVPDIDWDGDGVVSNQPVSVDVNEDGKCVSPGAGSSTTPAGDDVLLSDGIIHDGPNRRCDTAADAGSGDVQKRPVGAEQPDILAGHHDWSAIVLNPREFGEDADAPINPVETERSLEEWQEAEDAFNRPPVSDPNGPHVEECQGETTAVQLDGSASVDPDGDPITFEWTTDCPGGVFDDPASAAPILTLTSPPPCPVACSAMLTVSDPGGLSDTESTGVTVEDTTAPTISVELTPTRLSPPNHKLVNITATVIAGDLCDPSPTVELTSILSDEPDDAPGNGDGHTVGDIQGAEFGTADFHFQLRSERAGTGNGRSYTVTYKVTDECGLSASAAAKVVVPHDQKSMGSPMKILPPAMGRHRETERCTRVQTLGDIRQDAVAGKAEHK